MGASAHGYPVAFSLAPLPSWSAKADHPRVCQPRAHSKDGSRLGQSIVKIIPTWIGRDDQSNLPSSTPAFQAFLPLDSGPNVIVALEEYETSQAVALREALYQPLA